MVGTDAAGGAGSARVRRALAAARGERTPGTIAVDVVAIVVSLISIVTTIRDPFGPWQHLPSWWHPWDIAVGVLGSLALWWRRRHPVLIAGLLGIGGGVFLTAGTAALVAVYTLASLRRPWIALVISLAHLAIAIPYLLVVPVYGMTMLQWTVVMVLLYVSVLLAGLAVRARRALVLALVEAAERERRDQQRRLALAREAERARISREMHDVLAHRLSLLSVHAGALERRATSAKPMQPDEIGAAAVVIRSSAHQALEDLRDLLGLLGDDGDELGTAAPQPTVADLEPLVADAETAGQRVSLTVSERVTGLRPQLQRTVYRVVQEGLTNARKHAPGASVDVLVTNDEPDAVRVRVANPLPVGVAPSEVPGSRSGLIGLAERVQLDGGSVATEVVDGAFVLEASLPWRS